MQNPKPPKINDKRSEDYRTIFVNGYYGGFQLDYFHVIMQNIMTNANESLSDQPTIDRVDETCLVMTPTQVKNFWDWLGNHIEKYEERTGKKIPTPEELTKIADKKVTKGSAPTSSGPTGMFG